MNTDVEGVCIVDSEQRVALFAELRHTLKR